MERQLILRKFNLEQLGMETHLNGTTMSRIIGMGQRRSDDTGEYHSVVDFYYSYFRRLVGVFETTPIVKYFGISLVDALSLPVNQWHEIEKQAKILSEKEPAESEQSKTLEILKTLVEHMSGQS